MNDNSVVGIYLGPNNCAISIWKNQQVEIISNIYTGERKMLFNLRKATSFFPEQIYEMVFQKLIFNIRALAGSNDIKNAIITVPSYFNVSQRKEIKTGKKCGVNVLRIVNEETAACYAYRLYKDKKKKNILFFDVRSNETNVTFLNLQDSIFEIKGSVRDDNLGGNSFNEELIKFCLDEFKKRNGIIIKKHSTSYKTLEKACEKSINNLSQYSESLIELDKLDGKDLIFIYL